MLNPDDYLYDPYTPNPVGSDGSRPPAAAVPPTTPGATTPPATTPSGPKVGDRQYPTGVEGPYWLQWDGSQWVRMENMAYGQNYDRPGSQNTAVDPYNPQTVGQPSWGANGPFEPYQSAGPFKPRQDTFSYDPYTPSSWEDAEAEPGFKQSQDRLRKEIEAGAAYRGMLRSGMTLTDLDTGLGSSRRQNFESFDSRRFRNYSANRDNAFGAFTANYGIDRDIYDRGATDTDRGNNYRFNVSSQKFQDALARWQEQVRSMTSIATAGAGS